MFILVTGGAGFIGSHLTDRLLDHGHQVIVLDNLSSGKLDNLGNYQSRAGLTFINGDILSIEKLAIEHQALFGQIEAIYHLAALVSVAESIQNPQKSWLINLVGTHKMLEYAKTQKVKRFVLASSAAIYGQNPDLPKVENMRAEPISPYGEHKYKGEQIGLQYHRDSGLPFVGLRFFNVFGPRQDPSSPYSGVISIFASSVKEGKTPIIYGDGLQTRDFVPVESVVDALCLALQNPAAAGEVLNVGTGNQVTLIEVLCMLGYQGEIEYRAERDGDIRYSQADIVKINKVLGYCPRTEIGKYLIKLC